MRKILVSLTLSLGLTPLASAQVLYSGGTYSQNFDTLVNSPANTALTFTDNTTLTGWYSVSTVAARYRVSTGSDTTGSLYSFGASGSTERALGSLASNTSGDIYYGVRLQNTSASTFTSFSLSYTGEQWRNGGNTSAQTLAFSYSTTATGVNTGTYTSDTALAFATPTVGATAATLDGNGAANRANLSKVISGISWAPGSDLWLRWFDLNDAGNDHGVAIDNLTFIASAGSSAPEPASGVWLLVGGAVLGACPVRKGLGRR